MKKRPPADILHAFWSRDGGAWILEADTSARYVAALRKARARAGYPVSEIRIYALQPDQNARKRRRV